MDTRFPPMMLIRKVGGESSPGIAFTRTERYLSDMSRISGEDEDTCSQATSCKFV